MTRLLAFGDDGSAGADVAWLWINEQRWAGWNLEVLSATLPPIGPPPGEAAAEPRRWTPPQPRPVFADAGFSEVSYLHADADPRYVLATRTRCDLLVVGARGRGLSRHCTSGARPSTSFTSPRFPSSSSVTPSPFAGSPSPWTARHTPVGLRRRRLLSRGSEGPTSSSWRSVTGGPTSMPPSTRCPRSSSAPIGGRSISDGRSPRRSSPPSAAPTSYASAPAGSGAGDGSWQARPPRPWPGSPTRPSFSPTPTEPPVDVLGSSARAHPERPSRGCESVIS